MDESEEAVVVVGTLEEAEAVVGTSEEAEAVAVVGTSEGAGAVVETPEGRGPWWRRGAGVRQFAWQRTAWRKGKSEKKEVK